MADDFDKRNRQLTEEMAADEYLRNVSRQWFERASRYEYSYHFTWLGRPIIQFPQDIIATQEIIWATKPDLIIETGVARGGSMIFYASMLELLGGNGIVVGIDIDIRPHNRKEIEMHPFAGRIRMIEGSSVDESVVERVREFAERKQRVLVALDSNHTHAHVLQELKHYSQFVTEGSYLLVFDTITEYMPPEFSANRPWSPSDNPGTALREFLSATDRFVVDEAVDKKLLITATPGGYLRCVKP